MTEKAKNSLLCKPPWLDDQPGIKSLLEKVVTKLDSKPGATPGYTINKKLLPELFVQDEAADLAWGQLQTLFADPISVFHFRENKKRNFLDPEFSNARLIFQADAETLLRNWLNRPAVESELQKWQHAIDKHKESFPGDISRLRARVIAVPGKTPAQVVNGFVKIKEYLTQELTLRSLSARCFWQDSKFLEKRDELVKIIYPEINIKTRPVLVNIYLPETIEGVLFIENQDSYTQAMLGFPEQSKNRVLVYSSGFKLTAERIRHREGVSLHFSGNTNPSVVNEITNWWYGESIHQWSVSFWGDLDYSGMAILANLKKRFTEIQAWQEGYQPLLKLLTTAHGHSPEATSKQNQKDPLETGCPFADEKLLPALRETGLFVDQEWFF